MPHYALVLGGTVGIYPTKDSLLKTCNDADSAVYRRFTKKNHAEQYIQFFKNLIFDENNDGEKKVESWACYGFCDNDSNGHTSNAASLVIFQKTHKEYVDRLPGPQNAHRVEIYSVIRALELINIPKDNKLYLINTNSKHVLDSVYKAMSHIPLKNHHEIPITTYMIDLIKRLTNRGFTVKFKYHKKIDKLLDMTSIPSDPIEDFDWEMLSINVREEEFIH